MTNKTKIHHKAVQAQLAAIELAKQRYVAFQWALRGLESNRQSDERLNDAIQVVFSALVREEIEKFFGRSIKYEKAIIE